MRRDGTWDRLTFTAHSPTEFSWSSAEVADSVASRLQRPDECTDAGGLNASLLSAASLGLRLAGHTNSRALWSMPDDASGSSAERLFTLLLGSALADDRAETMEPLVERELTSAAGGREQPVPHELFVE